jgi:hypothetical protein
VSARLSWRASARGHALASLVALASAHVGCSKPAPTAATRESSAGSEAGGSAERDATDERGDADAVGETGAWAPRNSLARIERVPRDGSVETRSSLSGSDRVVLLVPIADDGNTLFEIFGMPGRDPRALAIGVRAVHEPPRWTECGTLTVRAGERTLSVEDARPDAAPSPLGTIETVRARTTLEDLRAVGDADALTVEACEDRFEVRGVGGHLAELMARFAEAEAD